MDSPFETDDPFPSATPPLPRATLPPPAHAMPPAAPRPLEPHVTPPAAAPLTRALEGPPAGIPPIDFRAALNDEQYAAVTAPPGPLLVLAGAGSGKTRTLTYRVAYLLAQGVRPGDILLLTFTNKASKEMLHRVEELTGVEPRRFWGGTFHSIGHRALRMFGEEAGLPKNFTILDADESETLLKQTVDIEDKAFFKDKTNPRPGPLFSIISLARNTRRTIPDTIEKQFPHYAEIKYAIPPFAAAYAEKKRAQNVCDYDDLLDGWLALLEKSPAVADYFTHRFRHLLVDEYQDTNTLQARIIDRIATHHRIMAVGDDAQCIYSWRGADFENIMTFPERHPGAAIHRIETNYRSTPEILALANGVLEAQPKGRHFDKELRAARAHAQKPMLVETLDEREQAEFVCKRIRALIEDEGVAPGGIAILYRSHYIAMEMQLVLSRAAIPYHITSGVKFFERQHIRDIVALITFACNPGNEMAWQRIACLLPKVGEKSAQKIHAAAMAEVTGFKLQVTNADAAAATEIPSGQSETPDHPKAQIPNHAARPRPGLIDALRTDAILAKVPKDARADWPNFCASLAEVADTMHAGDAGAAADGGPARTIGIAIDGWYGDYLRGAFADYTERLDELKALAGFAARFETIQDFLAQIILLSGEVSDRQVDPDAGTVKLTTVHQAKGLEYDVVFVIGMADGQFPGRRAIESDAIEEERRLFYVAVTRAKNELYLCLPKIATKAGPGGMMLTPSRFLAELNSALYEPLRLRRSFW